MKKFITRVNWRQVAIHYVAIFCLVPALPFLAFLTDMEIVEMVRKEGFDHRKFSSASDIAERFVTLNMVRAYSSLLGQFLAIVIPAVICFRNKWFWLNSFLSFILVFLTNFFLPVNQYLFNPFSRVLFKTFEDNMFLAPLLGGLFFLLITFLLFFLKTIKNFINKGYGEIKSETIFTFEKSKDA